MGATPEGRMGETPLLDNRCQALTVTLAVVRRSRWYFERSQLMQTNRMAWSCRINIATLLRGLQLDLITWGLEFHLDQYNYRSVDIAISPTRRRRNHRCDSSCSCDPIASVTDLVSAGATAITTPKAGPSLPKGSGQRASQKTVQSVVNISVSSRLCLSLHPSQVHAVARRVGTAAQKVQMIEGRRRRRTSALEVYLEIHRYFWSRTDRFDALPTRKSQLML